jgi:N6-L-threonylcarbamoyladenine synthase
MLTLGIESTCDETAAAIVKDGQEILSNIVSSQITLHQPYGGVYPELACRCHLEMVIPIIDEALKQAKVTKKDLDLIAVANGPGLIGALLIGINIAKGLSLALNKPLIGVNHVEAHLYASMMENLSYLQFPSLGVVISGGHTMLLKILEMGEYELIGTTIDDAIGEAFDKVGSILGLSYPGGPAIESLAKMGDEKKYPFTPAQLKGKPFHFSFSGLKTKILYTVKGQSSQRRDPIRIKEEEKKHIAASFQRAALSDIVDKAISATKIFHCRGIYLGGGVSNNQKLREMFKEKNLNIPIFWPPKGLSLDNAAMIAGLGYQKFIKKGGSDPLSIEAYARRPLIQMSTARD